MQKSTTDESAPDAAGTTMKSARNSQQNGTELPGSYHSMVAYVCWQKRKAKGPAESHRRVIGANLSLSRGIEHLRNISFSAVYWLL
jgi:hypothetical protein